MTSPGFKSCDVVQQPLQQRFGVVGRFPHLDQGAVVVKDEDAAWHVALCSGLWDRTDGETISF